MKLVPLLILGLFPVSLVFAATTNDVNLITLNPTSLAFGSVPAGQAKSLTTTITNGTALSLRCTASASAPFTVSPTSKSLAAREKMILTATLPATAAIGSYSNALTVDCEPAGVIGSRLKETVPVTAAVIQPPPDLSVATITIHDQGVNGQVRTVGFAVDLRTSGTAITVGPVKIFQQLGSDPETVGMPTQTLQFKPPGQTPFIYGSPFSTSYTKVTIRVVADPDNTVTEGNETNNELKATFDFP